MIIVAGMCLRSIPCHVIFYNSMYFYFLNKAASLSNVTLSNVTLSNFTLSNFKLWVDFYLQVGRVDNVSVSTGEHEDGRADIGQVPYSCVDSAHRPSNTLQLSSEHYVVSHLQNY